MAHASKTTLKTYFNTGDKPTETQFASLIDSNLNETDGGSITGSLKINPGASQSFAISASLSAIKFNNLPDTLAKARLIGSGSLYASGSIQNGGGKAVYVFTG